MNRSIRLLTVPSVALALASGALAQPDARPSTPPADLPVAQPTPRPSAPASNPPIVKPRNEPVERPLIDIEFPGGTFEEFVQKVLAASNPSPNIVVMPDLERVRIGKISLKRITILSALQAAITASEDSEQSRRWGVTLDDTAGQSVLYRVGVDYNRFSPPAPSGKPVGRSLQVFPFREWTGSPETMLSAIEGAMSMLDDRDRPRISFHQESGLLFVSGAPAHIDVVVRVLESMEQRANGSKDGMEIGAARRIIEALGIKDPAAALELFRDLKAKAAQLADAQVEAARSKAASEARLEAMAREMDDLKARAERRLVDSEKEIQRLQAINLTLQEQLRVLQNENRKDREQPETGAKPK